MMVTADQALERATTTPDTQQPRTVQAQLERMADHLEALLPAGVESSEFMAAVYNEIKYSAKLSEIAKDYTRAESLWCAITTCAQLGLTPGKATGEAWIIPRWDKHYQHPDRTGRGAELAVFQLGYRGTVTLCDRSGRFSPIIGGHAYPGEIVDESSGIIDGKLTSNFVVRPMRPRPVHPTHVPGPNEFEDPASGHTEDVVFYVCFEVDGVPIYHAMGARETYDHYLRTHPRRDKGGNSASRGWTAWDGHYPTMALVQCFRLATRFLPKTSALQRAFDNDGAVRLDRDPEAIDHAEHDDVTAAVEILEDTLHAGAEAAAELADALTEPTLESYTPPPEPEPEPDWQDRISRIPKASIVEFAAMLGHDPLRLRRITKPDIVELIASAHEADPETEQVYTCDTVIDELIPWIEAQ